MLSDVFKHPTYFNLNDVAKIFYLFFVAFTPNNAAGFGQNRTLTESLPASSAAIAVTEVVSGGAEVLYEYTFEQAGYLLKVGGDFILSQGVAAATITLAMRALLQFPDVRGQQIVMPSQSVTTGNVAAGVTTAHISFPGASTYILVPAGSKLLIGLTLSAGGGGATPQILAANPNNVSVISVKFAPIPDSTLIFAKTRRVS